jgi:hypothetical protein
MLYNGRGMYITCWAPSMVVVSDLSLMDLAPREYGSQGGVAKILSTRTVAGRPDPLVSRRREGPVIDASLGSGPRGFFLFSSTISSRHFHNRYSSQLLSLHIFIMSEPPSLRGMEPSPCPKKGLFQRLGTQFMSAVSRSGAGSRNTAPSHKDDSVAPPIIPETSPVSNQSQQDQTANDNGTLSRLPGGVEGRLGLFGTLDPGQWAKRLRKPLDDSEGDGDERTDFDGYPFGKPYSTSWGGDGTSFPPSHSNARSRSDSEATSYPQTAGTELPNGTKSNH